VKIVSGGMRRHCSKQHTDQRRICKPNAPIVPVSSWFRTDTPRRPLALRAPDAAANETAEETAHTVASAAIDGDESEARSARWIGNENP
jgi:hypothetical protein